MQVDLLYGRDGLRIELPDDGVDVLQSADAEPLADERAAFIEAMRQPLGTAPLAELVTPTDRVAVVIPDITRPLPSHLLLPWLFAELSHVPAGQITVLNGTGSHRANTPTELERMVGREILDTYEIVNHDAYAAGDLVTVGATDEGTPVAFNRRYVEADKRILLGFIEPHFMAGFSGGFKAVFPGLLGIDSIMHYHRASVIGDPLSTWGRLDGNPTQAQIRRYGSLVPATFCINVTLNRAHRITHVFAGDTVAVHDAGCAHMRRVAMTPVKAPYPIVITTNCGYPLDQNLYQTVKGMSAAAQIVEPGGYILTASECSDGFPEHGNFKKLLFDHDSPEAILTTITAPGFSMYDQWEAQILAMIRRRARVGLYSSLPHDEVRRAHLEPVADLAAAIAPERGRLGGTPRIAVLPEGFLSIPYLAPGA